MPSTNYPWVESSVSAESRTSDLQNVPEHGT